MSSSPWMRGAPQVGFSATIRKINSRICLEILRPPPTRFRALQSMVQYNLNPAWCHRATVSGRTRSSDLSNRTRCGALRPRTVCRVPSVLASGACVSTQRVVGRARDFLTSGCVAHEKSESRLRTRAETASTWQQWYSRLACQAAPRSG
jgi:hypothetical protein